MPPKRQESPTDSGSSAATLENKYGSAPYMGRPDRGLRSRWTIVFSLGKARIVEAMARFVAPITQRLSKPKRSWIDRCESSRS